MADERGTSDLPEATEATTPDEYPAPTADEMIAVVDDPASTPDLTPAEDPTQPDEPDPAPQDAAPHLARLLDRAARYNSNLSGPDGAHTDAMIEQAQAHGATLVILDDREHDEGPTPERHAAEAEARRGVAHAPSPQELADYWGVVAHQALANEGKTITKRPTSPGAERELGVKHPVLGEGYIALVDYLGNDESVVKAARLSYGQGTRSASDDAALTAYLIMHRHTSPVEAPTLEFLIQAPIFVARQFYTHRASCLGGGTRLIFDLPGGGDKRRAYGVPLARFCRQWHEGVAHPVRKRLPLQLARVDPEKAYTPVELAALTGRTPENLRSMARDGRLPGCVLAAGRVAIPGHAYHHWATHDLPATNPARERLGRMRLRMCDEATGEIAHTSVTNVWAVGVKPVFRVTLENGKAITMTAEHRCLTERGWLPLGEAVVLRRGVGGTVAWDAAAPAFATNGVPAYQTAEWLGGQRSAGLGVAEIATEAGVSYHTIRKWLRVHGLQYNPVERGALGGKALVGRRRTVRHPRVFNEADKATLRAARSGPRSNFWKGGVTPERKAVGRWTAEQAPAVHARCGYRCAVCEGARDLQAHHIDPVWHNPARGKDEANLLSLCRDCHQRLHVEHLELAFLAAVEQGQSLGGFFGVHEAQPWPVAKQRPPGQQLMRAWSRVARIEYAGEEMVYDLSVAGPYQNFVADGFIVHNSRTEVSYRYSEVPEGFYLPDVADMHAQDTKNRQGRGAALDADDAVTVRGVMERANRNSQEVYHFLTESAEVGSWGVAREIARQVQPVAAWTVFRWKQDLHNLLHFLSLRLKPNTQLETRRVAEAIAEVVAEAYPVVWAAWYEHVFAATTLSAQTTEAVAQIVYLMAKGMGPAGARLTEAARAGLDKRQRVQFDALVLLGEIADARG